MIDQKAKSDAATGSPATGKARLWTALGIGLIVFVLYTLSHPGRIDIVDGQYRYEIAQNLLHEGRPVIFDRQLIDLEVGSLPGLNGEYYSFYGVGGSAVAMPILMIADLFTDYNGDLHRFLFSLISAFAGALVACVLFLFYCDIGASYK